MKRTSVTIIIITPEAISHKKDWCGNYDDWMYDEIRYSLEDREDNRCNGIVAVYVPEAKGMLIQENIHKCQTCNTEKTINTILNVDNLFRKNMMNVKKSYKTNPCEGVYDSDKDSYCSLVSWDDFKTDYIKYIENAEDKREHVDRYDLVKRM